MTPSSAFHSFGSGQSTRTRRIPSAKNIAGGSYVCIPGRIRAQVEGRPYFRRSEPHLALARPAPRERKGHRREIECLFEPDGIGDPKADAHSRRTATVRRPCIASKALTPN